VKTLDRALSLSLSLSLSLYRIIGTKILMDSSGGGVVAGFVASGEGF
jgi:hypothetical protein